MRRQAMFAFLSLALCALISTAAIAEDVYITKHGKRYHKEGSRFIKNKEVEKISREEAEAKGYKPSSEFLSEDEKKQSDEPKAADTSKAKK